MRMLLPLICFALSLSSCKKEPIAKWPPDTADTVTSPNTNPYQFKLIWRTPMAFNPKGFVSLAPAILGNDVAVLKMFGGPDSILMLRDGKTGAIKWAFSDPIDIKDGSEAGPLAVENGQIVLNAGNQLYVIDPGKGRALWKYDLTPIHDNACAGPRLNCYDNFIYHVHSECNSPYQQHGALVRSPISHTKWDTLILLNRENGFSPFIDPPSFWIHPSGDTMLVFQNRQPGHSKNKVDLYSFNLRTREITWKIENLDPTGYSNPAIPLIWKDKIYFQGFYTVYCIDASTGAIRWKRIRDQFYEQLTACSMLIVDDKLVLRSNYGHTFALDPNTGGDLWINTQLIGTSYNMVEHNGVIYFTGHKGSVTAIDVKTGEKLATYKSPNAGKWSDANFITELSINLGLGYLYASDGYETFCLKAIK